MLCVFLKQVLFDILGILMIHELMFLCRNKKKKVFKQVLAVCHRITISLSCCKMLYPHKPKKFIWWCLVSVLLILCAMEAISDLLIIIVCQESRFVGVLDNLPNQTSK